jgi:hypothetical protein
MSYKRDFTYKWTFTGTTPELSAIAAALPTDSKTYSFTHKELAIGELDAFLEVTNFLGEKKSTKHKIFITADGNFPVYILGGNEREQKIGEE